MTDNEEKLVNQYIDNLTQEEMEQALFNCIEQLIMYETAGVREDATVYWDANGEDIKS